MKKALSLILALVLCFGLCACGAEGKYVGQYIETSSYSMLNSVEWLTYKSEIELTGKGEGTYVCTATKDHKFISAGVIVEEGTVSWEVVDDYIVITQTGTNYLGSQEAYDHLNSGYYKFYDTSGNKPVSNTRTFELKGNILVNVEDENDTIKKVQ